MSKVQWEAGADPTSLRFATAALSALLAAAALAACGRPADVIEISKERVASRPSVPVVDGVTSAQRFGASRLGPTAAQGGAGGAAASPLQFDAPEGWEVLPASSLRPVNLRPGGHPDAECYVTVLTGDGGGLVANVDRWRKQLGLEPMTPAEVDALPEVPLLGAQARRVVLEGAYSGMGDDARAGWKLVGLVLIRTGSAVFVKLTGPADVVDAELERFEGFCASLREGDVAAVGTAQGSSAQPPASAPPPASAGAGGPFAWQAPPGWVEDEPRPMRLVSFQIGQASQCYITVLGGEGGGLVANLDRWRGELGLEPTGPEEVAAMPRVPMLGREAVVFEGVGTFSSMGSEPLADQAMLGAICLREADSVFVKMVGPREEVQPRRTEFVEFLASLEEVGR